MKKIALIIIILFISVSVFAATIYEAATKEDMLYLLNSVVQDGDTVKLLNDINLNVLEDAGGDRFSVPTNCLVTLDLNGKHISAGTARCGNWIGAGANSALIIKNGTIENIDTNENDTGVLVISNVSVGGFWLGTTQSWLVNGTNVRDLSREEGRINPNSDIEYWVGAYAPAIVGNGTNWKCYSTIQQDFQQANNSGNEKIILLSDLNLTSDATLSAAGRLFDLSGYTINLNSTSKLSANNSTGEVTFRNGKVSGNVYAKSTNPDASLRLQDLTVIGTVYSEGETVYIESGYYNSLQKTGNFKISGGKYIEKPSADFLAKSTCYIEEINEVHDGKTYNWIVYQDFYVADWGNDETGDGTKETPFRTIGKANNEVRADNVTIKLLTDIEQSSPVDMIGKDLRVDGLGKKLIGPTLYLRIGSKVTIRNIILDGNEQTYGNNEFLYSDRSRLTLDNGTVFQNIKGAEDGIIVADNGTVLTINPGAEISGLEGNRGIIRINNSTLDVVGGEITGNTVNEGGVISSNNSNSIIKIHGKPYINKNYITSSNTHANVFLLDNQVIDLSSHMVMEPLVSVGTQNKNYFSDILVGENALLYDAKHMVADDLTQVGIVYCDGTKDYYSSGREVENPTNHVHTAGTIWLSTAAAHEHTWEYVGDGYKLIAYCAQERTHCDNYGIENGIVLDLRTDNHERLIPSFIPSNATHKYVFWESSNPEVAKIDSNGNVWAQSAGETTITAEAADEGLAKTTLKVTVIE